MDQKEQAEHFRFEEHQKREEAERSGAWLRTQLEAERKNVAALTKKLAEAEAKSSSKAVSAGKKLLDSEKMVAEVDAKRKSAEMTATMLKKRIQEMQKKSHEAAVTQESQRKQIQNMTQKLESSDRKYQDTEARLVQAGELMERYMADSNAKSVRAARELADTSDRLNKVTAKEKKASATLKEVQKQKDVLEKQIAGTKLAKIVAQAKQKDAEVRRDKAEKRTFRLAIRGAVRGGTGVVEKDGTVKHWRIR